MRPKTFGGASGRIPQICTRLHRCAVFADIGCDHGYCTQYMLENNLCDRAVISDISQKSLDKAIKLLAEYARAGRLQAVCCDGMQKVGEADLVLIAGMGGEEIIKILDESYIPSSFVFQPMKNAELLRRYLIQNNCAIDEDNIFKDGKYYFIIKGRAVGGSPDYTPAALAFGRDSLGNHLLKDYLADEMSKIKSYLANNINNTNREILNDRLSFLNGVYCGEIY